MKRGLILPVYACALAIVTAPLRAQASPGGSEAAVRAVVDQLFEGMRRADSGMVRPLFHPRARLITLSGDAVRIEESVDGFVRSIGRPRTEVWDERLFNVKVSIDGPLASVWTDYAFYRGPVFSHCGVDHFLLVRQDGAWQIIELADTRRTTGCAG